MVDVTSTINTIFGAKIMDAEIGLILNDEMDDFAVAPGVPNAFKLVQAEANAIAPGKRPLSSMAPLIAMRDGRPAMVVGGSGGPTIITGVTQVTVEALDLRMDAADAVGAPRIHGRLNHRPSLSKKACPRRRPHRSSRWAIRSRSYRNWAR